MPRLPRIDIAGIPYHVTQRGNRRQDTFFSDHDMRLYLHLLAVACANYKVQIWAYCLMPNHVHLILFPLEDGALRRALSEAHRAYTLVINQRNGSKGCFWQGRFFSTPLDETYLIYAVRYTELNPVRAGLVSHAADYPWSSASAHLKGEDNGFVIVQPMLERVQDWGKFLDMRDTEKIRKDLRDLTRTGRPAGDERFYDRLSQLSGLDFHRKKAGRRPRMAT